MASAPPDAHPDSFPSGPSTDVEQVSPTPDPGRENIEQPAERPDNGV